jgi:hypothetical protein
MNVVMAAVLMAAVLGVDGGSVMVAGWRGAADALAKLFQVKYYIGISMVPEKVEHRLACKK